MTQLTSYVRTLSLQNAKPDIPLPDPLIPEHILSPHRPSLHPHRRLPVGHRPVKIRRRPPPQRRAPPLHFPQRLARQARSNESAVE